MLLHTLLRPKNMYVMPHNSTYSWLSLNKIELKRSLYCLFSAYGKIISIVATKTQSGRGQAFIAFTDIVASTTALRGLQGFTFYGKALVRILTCLDKR